MELLFISEFLSSTQFNTKNNNKEYFFINAEKLVESSIIFHGDQGRLSARGDEECSWT